MNRLKTLLLMTLLLWLSACRTSPEVIIYAGAPLPEPPAEAPPVLVDHEQFQQERMFADLLYEAKRAFDDNRLMLPAGRNAYESYQQVLRLDPGNKMALQGIEEIALRYITMAETAINAGSFDNAENYLVRAAQLGPDRPELDTARTHLETARKVHTQVHELNAAGLTAHSLQVMTDLAEIARQIQASGATFLIRARSDEEGRWIYQTMRDAVGGNRLHGNIDIAGTPGIVVSAPAGDSKNTHKALTD